MKRLFSLLFCLFLPVFQAGAALEFESTSSTKRLEPADDTATVTFSFKNAGEESVRILKVDSNCGCIRAETDKMLYAKGESGTVTAEFRVGSSTGTLSKVVTVAYKEESVETSEEAVEIQPEKSEASADTDAGKPELISPIVKTARLRVLLNVPSVMELDPNPVKWALGGKPEPKVMRLSVTHDKPVHIKSVRTSRDNVTVEVKTVEKGKLYDLILTPKSLEKVQLGMVIVETDCDIARHAKKLGYFSIIRAQLGPSPTTSK